MNMLRWIVIACGMMLLVMAAARADEPGEFSKGTWTVTGYGSYTQSFYGERARIGAGTIGGGYYILDNFSINAELSGYYNAQHGPDAIIAGADLLIRHPLYNSGRFSLFIDGGAAITYANNRTPYYGTYYNYILETGLGATFQIYENVHLIGGARYFHLSNAHLEGPAHNPSINGLQGYLGVLFTF
jgi:hypothetical protein